MANKQQEPWIVISQDGTKCVACKLTDKNAVNTIGSQLVENLQADPEAEKPMHVYVRTYTEKEIETMPEFDGF